jgi:hypothetical protein
LKVHCPAAQGQPSGDHYAEQSPAPRLLPPVLQLLEILLLFLSQLLLLNQSAHRCQL